MLSEARAVLVIIVQLRLILLVRCTLGEAAICNLFSLSTGGDAT